MRKPISVLLCCVGLVSAGCNDLGTCGKAEEKRAREMVVNGEGLVMYAGQAIINRSCAAGQCHSSGAVGDSRQGVPKGFDFNLEPAAVAPAGAKDAVDSQGILLDSQGLASLRKNQRKVFDEREEIWEQIESKLMPPEGVGADYRSARPGAELTVDTKTGACGRGSMELNPISSGATRSIVRNWLACGAPVVEVSNASVSVSTLRQEPKGKAGTVGQQVPVCQDCEKPITFDDLYSNVFQTCVAGCHTAGGIADPEDYEGFDLSDVDKAYASLTEGALGGSDDCNKSEAAPLVKKGDAKGSYIIAKMGGGLFSTSLTDLKLCGSSMPQGQPPLDCGVRQIATWINAGALGPGKGTGSSSADAGM